MSFRCVVHSTALALAIAVGAVAAAPEAGAQAAPAPAPNSGQSWWLPRHQQKLEELRARKPTLLFLGDSITQDYEYPSAYPPYNFQGVWNYYYGDRNAINLGFQSDNTSNLLWRLQNGEIDGVSPKLAVILIGTNDTAQGRPAEQVTAGIDAIVNLVHAKAPQAKILLLGILPTDFWPQKIAADQAVNAYLMQRYAPVPYVTVMNLWPVFTTADGVIDKSLFMDPRNNPPQPAVHPDAFGQARMAAAIEPTVAKLLKDRPKPPMPPAPAPPATP